MWTKFLQKKAERNFPGNANYFRIINESNLSFFISQQQTQIRRKQSFITDIAKIKPLLVDKITQWRNLQCAHFPFALFIFFLYYSACSHLKPNCTEITTQLNFHTARELFLYKTVYGGCFDNFCWTSCTRCKNPNGPMAWKARSILVDTILLWLMLLL